jgi:L-lysine 6-transaminase
MNQVVDRVQPKDVVAELAHHILVDGFKLIFDPVNSHGSKFADAKTGREWLDLYSFYASQPIGFNHPYFAKFSWPRVMGPSLDFSLPPGEREAAVAEKERLAEAQIRAVLAQKAADIAAIIIEPIQGEGGDNHFRAEFFQVLRRLCDENDVLLIFDEVQSGMGITGRNWCCEHFGVLPDLLVFGKKAQVCGVMAGPRLDEVKDNCFRLPSRISSTWGGNFTDFVRSTHYLKIIEAENLVENARAKGRLFLAELERVAREHAALTAARGRGLMLAFDLPNAERRDEFWKSA